MSETKAVLLERSLRSHPQESALEGSEQYQAMNLFNGVFVTPPRVLRRECIEDRRAAPFSRLHSLVLTRHYPKKWSSGFEAHPPRKSNWDH
jgi:hypothetical protein